MVEVIDVLVMAAAIATIIGVYSTLKEIVKDITALMKKTRPSVPPDSPVSEKGSQEPDSTFDE